MRSRPQRAWQAALLALAGAAALHAGPTDALEGGFRAPRGHFGIVGCFALSRADLGSGFSGVQVAPRWVLTAAHVAPPVGAIFVDDYGMSGVAEVVRFSNKAPASTPLKGAISDDLALVRLAAPIASPYFPRLADDGSLPSEGRLSAAAHSHLLLTLASNNPSIKSRRYGFAAFAGLYRAPGYDFLVVASGNTALVAGDSGSPLFVSQLLDTDQDSILAGIASGQTRSTDGVSIGVYTRIGAYRALLDAAVGSSGETLRWSSVPAGRAAPTAQPVHAGDAAPAGVGLDAIMPNGRVKLGPSHP